MLRLSRLAPLAAACALALGGCTHYAISIVRDQHQPACNPQADTYAMQCALTEAPRTLAAPAPVKAYGGDFGWASVSAASARSHGWKFAASYLSTDPSKDWNAALIASYAKSAISRVFVWETYANRALGGCAAGTQDARSAWRLGAPFGARVLYFAVDFDETPAQGVTVASYFRCVDRVLGVSHVGAYGGYWSVSRLFNAHLITYGWQTYAWSGGLWDHRAQLEQYLNGSAYDYDRALSRDYGQTPYAAPTPKPKPKPNVALKEQLRWLRGLRHTLRLQLWGVNVRIHSVERALTR